MSSLAAGLLDRINTRQARVGVVGLGYVGLPLAVAFARSGFVVTGIDLDHTKIASLQSDQSYIPDVSSLEIASLRRAGRLGATTDFASIAELDTINICVPTPLRKTKDPDLSFIVQAVEAIAAHLRPGMLVILESTTYPGTTEEVVQPLLERSGLRAGVDFFLAFSPERVDPGNETFNTNNVPKVVGGMTPTCAEVARALYGSAIETVIGVSSPRVAEMVKLLENTFRAVNIGLVNEIALMCDRLGIDVWEVIDAAKTKPFGFMPFYPGPGLGGHCIPIDPFYLSWKARESGFELRFIELAGYVNSSMPAAVVDKIADALNRQKQSLNGARVLIAGISYKRDIKDIRESPALDVMGLLAAKGAVLSYIDPHVPHLRGHEWHGGVDLWSLDPASLGSPDCVAILTDHHAFDYQALLAAAPVVVDSRNAIKLPYPHVFRLGAPQVPDSRRTARFDVEVGSSEVAASYA